MQRQEAICRQGFSLQGSADVPRPGPSGQACRRRARTAGGRLDEVRILLRYLDRPAADCGEVNAVLDEHIEQVARRVRELKLQEKQLRELRAHCNSERKGQPCGILEELNADRRSADGIRRLPSSGHTHVGAVHGRPGTPKRQ